ncbi:hypothetical protein [Amycolatopsis thermoflava]|uniref:hypothetical protein n=1 Tax=Amycolatopsis thermoflava TaxID=84480 RepID=UPI0037F42980
MKKWLFVAVSSALVAACGSKPAPNPDTVVPEPPRMQGVAVLSSGNHGNRLEFVDPRTGTITTTLPLPATEKPLATQYSPSKANEVFSPDWRYAAARAGNGIQLYALDDAEKRYVPTRRITPPPEAGVIESFRFGGSGSKLWFTTGISNPVYSVDCLAPNSAPVQEAAALDHTWGLMWDAQGRLVTESVLTTIAPDGKSWMYSVADESGTIVDATLSVGSGNEYYLVAPPDGDTLLFGARSKPAGPALIRVVRDQAAGTIRVTAIADSPQPVTSTVVSPDQTEAVFATVDGPWFISSTAPGGTPRQIVVQGLPEDGTGTYHRVLGWA